MSSRWLIGSQWNTWPTFICGAVLACTCAQSMFPVPLSLNFAVLYLHPVLRLSSLHMFGCISDLIIDCLLFSSQAHALVTFQQCIYCMCRKGKRKKKENTCTHTKSYTQRSPFLASLWLTDVPINNQSPGGTRRSKTNTDKDEAQKTAPVQESCMHSVINC